MVNQIKLQQIMSKSRQKTSRLRRVFQSLTVVEPELSIEQDSQIVAGSTANRRRGSSDRTRVGSSVGWHEPSRTPSPSDRSPGSLRGTDSQGQNGNGTHARKGAVILMEHSKKIAMPQIRVVEVSRPWFYAYWGTLGGISILVGVIWGF